MKRFVVLLLSLIFFSHGLFAQGIEYKPGGKKFSKQWKAFYRGDHEPELPTPLISAGRTMVPYVCDAVSHPDMRLRRYAIVALGSLRDKRAIPTLLSIVKNSQEIDYFRGDSLEAIYQINRKLGVSLSDQYINETNYLKYSVEKIKKEENCQRRR